MHGKRKHRSAEFKAYVSLAALSGGKTLAELTSVSTRFTFLSFPLEATASINRSETNFRLIKGRVP